MLRMARKKTAPPGSVHDLKGQKKSTNRTGVPLHAWIDEALMNALNDYIDAGELKVSKTSCIEAALRDWLRGRGCLPKPSAGISS